MNFWGRCTDRSTVSVFSFDPLYDLCQHALSTYTFSQHTESKVEGEEGLLEGVGVDSLAQSKPFCPLRGAGRKCFVGCLRQNLVLEKRRIFLRLKSSRASGLALCREGEQIWT